MWAYMHVMYVLMCVRIWPSKSVRHCVEHLSFRVFLFWSSLSCCCCCFLSLLRIYSSFICVSWSFAFVCTMEEDYFWHSAHFNRVRTFTMRMSVCECLFSFANDFRSHHIPFCSHMPCIVYSMGRHRENNALKMDCAICCLVLSSCSLVAL